jgi:uncharacterized protein YyaL (SSP411 family)
VHFTSGVFDADNQVLVQVLRRAGAGRRQRVLVVLDDGVTNACLFDHLGGGFFRYCVDADWRIPHFEKMLYDNAALLGLLADAYAFFGHAEFRGAAAATADWLLAHMRDAGGGFYATLDADSEGEEGRYYTFSRADFESVLCGGELDAASAYFGLDQPPNFEGQAWHLQPRTRLVAFDAAAPAIAAARQRLLDLRATRVPPGRDDKILTAWNGLLAGQLARAARRLDQPQLGEAAMAALDCIRRELWRDGRLRASFKDGQARFAAYLDDYALTAFGLIELMQWRFRSEDLTFAIELCECLLAHFADADGGFFFTADDHEQLMHRSKPLADEALPSGNGMAALALDTLGHLLGEPRYLEAAARTVRAALPGIARYPEGHATLLAAIGRQLQAPEILIVRGPPDALAHWQSRLDTGFHPARLSFFIADTAGPLPGLLAARSADAGPVGYLCRGTECLAPERDLTALAAALAPN